MTAIYLGHCDAGYMPQRPAEILTRFHNVPGSRALKNRASLRDDDRSTWRRFKEIKKAPVNVCDIHDFLHSAGFMPRARALPMFDYVTQASVRLFQEYLRTIEGIASMIPDGIVGQKTIKHMRRWQSRNLQTAWGNNKPDAEYERWMQSLNLAKQHYSQHQPPVLKKSGEFSGATDTRNIHDWSFHDNDIHLIGIRSGEQIVANRRKSDDIFVLLINGKVFKFWGSTDPAANMGSRDDEAFLIEGQHKYRFSWHKINDSNKIYRALRPYRDGVLVLRDRDYDNALTDQDIAMGVDLRPNHTINIHWSGIGTTNWSAGCQVVAGQSYINDQGNCIDCSAFAATSYRDLNSTRRKTKAAYNMLSDLVLCYAKPDIDHLLYSLGRDESLLLTSDFDEDYVKNTFASMQT